MFDPNKSYINSNIFGNPESKSAIIFQDRPIWVPKLRFFFVPAINKRINFKKSMPTKNNLNKIFFYLKNTDCKKKD